jgi:hypothetical protein
VRVAGPHSARYGTQWIVKGRDKSGREAGQNWYTMEGATRQLRDLASGIIKIRLANDQEAVIGRKDESADIVYSPEYLAALAHVVEAALAAVPQEMQ